MQLRPILIRLDKEPYKNRRNLNFWIGLITITCVTIFYFLL